MSGYRKRIGFILAVMALILTQSSCGPKAADVHEDSRQEASVKILATIFPEYDWVREILGEQAANVQVDLLVDSGADLHSYQPSVKDIMDIASCDLFIYVGGESDSWVQETLKQTDRPGREVISLLEVLGDAAKEEETVEGMEPHEENENQGTEPSHGPEYDEHVWLSLKNAGIFCGAIAEKLAEIDPDHGETYRENAKSYQGKLSRLDRQYQDVVDGASQKVILFGDRFPFRYLVDDYGLSYYAAFAGCSAESEVSFQTVAFLAEKADEKGLSSILVIKGGDQKIAETICQNTRSGNQKILVMDSLQSTTGEEIQQGAAYLSVMEDNLNVLKAALE